MKENYKLKKPITFEGKEISEIEFDYEKITPDSYRRAVSEAKIRDEDYVISGIPIFSEAVKLVLVGIACSLPTDAILSFYPRDIIATSRRIEKYFFFEQLNDTDNDLEKEGTKTIYYLKDPVEIDGKKVTKITFDFDSVNYFMYKKCIQKVGLKNMEILNSKAYLNEKFQLLFAEKASGLDNDLIFKKLSARDLVCIGVLVFNFFAVGDSVKEKQEQN